MNKRLMSITTGALVALAFAALPATSSAGEFTGDCGSGATCAGTLAGGAAALSNTLGETTACTSVTGTTSQTSASSTGTIQFLFHGCVEKVSGFNFSCNSSGQASGTITTNAMVTHRIRIDPIDGTHPTGTPGLLVTGANLTYMCAGFTKMTYTGNFIGHFENPECGVARTNHSINFETTADGQQKYKQVTTTGTVFDLISNNDAGGEYRTAAISMTLTNTYSGGNTVKNTC